jgi:hypothetical protein
MNGADAFATGRLTPGDVVLIAVMVVGGVELSLR